MAEQAEVPLALERVVRHCLVKDPAERFQSIADVAFYLEALAGDVDSISRVSPTTERWRARKAKRMEKIGQIGLFRLDRRSCVLLRVTIAVFILYFRSDKPAGSIPTQATIKQLTSYTGTEMSGALSPDGRNFAFVSEKGGTPDIWMRRVSGGDSLQITSDEAVETDLIYAPDGETIYYSVTRIDLAY